MELQITQTRHPKSVVDSRTDRVDLTIDLRFAKARLVKTWNWRKKLASKFKVDIFHYDKTLSEKKIVNYALLMGLGRICHIQHPLLKYLSRNFSLCCLKLSLCVAQYSATKEIIVNRENEQTASIMLYVASHCQVIRNSQLVMFCCRHFATISGSSRIIEEQTIRSWKTCRTVLNKTPEYFNSLHAV